LLGPPEGLLNLTQGPRFAGSMPGLVLRVLCLAPFCGFLAWPRFAGSLPGPVLRVPCLAPFCGFLAWPRFAGSSRNPQNEEGSQRGLKFCGFLKEPTKQKRVWTDPTKRRGVPEGSKILRVHGFYWKVLRVPQGTHKTKGGPRGVSRFAGSLGRTLKVLRVPQGTDKTGSSRNRQNQGGSQRGFSFCGFLGG
jgi:hypothetical protein